MPDLIIEHPETRDISFIEVKFRATEKFNFNDFKGQYKYDNAYVILVSKENIKCLSVAQLKKNECMTPHCNNFLANRREFDLAPDILDEFVQYVKDFFNCV